MLDNPVSSASIFAVVFWIVFAVFPEDQRS